MQWIKVFANIFANPKMQLLLKERDGDTFFRIWMQLLAITGISIQGGKIMMSENTPMAVEDLATITHKSKKNSKYIGQVNPFWNVNLWGQYIQNQKLGQVPKCW